MEEQGAVQVEETSVKPYVYKQDDQFICVDFVRPVMRLALTDVEKGGDRYLHRVVEVMAVKTCRLILEMAEKLDWDKPIQIHDRPSLTQEDQ